MVSMSLKANKFLVFFALLSLAVMFFVAAVGMEASLVYDQTAHHWSCSFSDAACTPAEHVSEWQGLFASILQSQALLSIVLCAWAISAGISAAALLRLHLRTPDGDEPRPINLFTPFLSAGIVQPTL
jgi:hypothetical protein